MISKKWLLAAGTSALLAFGVAACGSSDDTGSDSSSSDSSSVPQRASPVKSPVPARAPSKPHRKPGSPTSRTPTPAPTISYDPVGSGGGREQFIAGGMAYAGIRRRPRRRGSRPGRRCAAATRRTCRDPGLHLADRDHLQPPRRHRSPARRRTPSRRSSTRRSRPGTTRRSPRLNPASTCPTRGSPRSTAPTSRARRRTSPTTCPRRRRASGPYQVRRRLAGQGRRGRRRHLRRGRAVTAGDGTIGYADASQAGDLGVARIKVGNDFVAPTPEGAAKSSRVRRSPRNRRRQYIFAFELDRRPDRPGHLSDRAGLLPDRLHRVRRRRTPHCQGATSNT